MTTHFEAWVMLPDDQVTDPKLENRLTPNVPVSVEQLHTLGVWHQAYDASTMCLPGPDGAPSPIDRIAAAMGYKNRDEVFIAPDKMPNYADKVRMFYEEHIHEDDEIRLVLKGGGFFDVRGHGDEWIRIRVTPGDFLVLPAGIYHRYGVDVSEFAHVMRLFAEAPKWIAVPRPCEDNAVRASYRLKHLRPGGPVPQTALGPCDPAAYNYHIQHPAGADDTLAPVLRDVAEGRTACAVVYVTGAHNPNTHQSWCPDCVTADPVVKAQVSAAREANARPVAFVHATVQRTSYLRNPAYPLRHHPLLRVRAIPTVLVFKAEGNGTDVVVSERLDGDVPESWMLQC